LSKVSSRDLERSGACVNAVQLPDSGSDLSGPATAATSEIEPDRIGWKFLPGEYGEVGVEQAFSVPFGQRALVKRSPLVAEGVNDFRIEVGHVHWQEVSLSMLEYATHGREWFVSLFLVTFALPDAQRR
jgi:hypothetical protein